MQMYGKLDGFPYNSALFGLVIYWPLFFEETKTLPTLVLGPGAVVPIDFLKWYYW